MRGEARPGTGDSRGARAVPGGAQDGGEPGGCGHGQVRGAAPRSRGRAPGEPVAERRRQSRGGRGGSVMEAGRLGATAAENTGRRAAVGGGEARWRGGHETARARALAAGGSATRGQRRRRACGQEQLVRQQQPRATTTAISRSRRVAVVGSS